MFLLQSRALRHYCLALLGTFVGAWLTGLTGSMGPLALGASALLLCTAPLVKAICTQKAR